MIIVQLNGGLGNQMFQYAIGRNLAIKNNSKLFLDVTELNKRDPNANHTYRTLELNIFNANTSIIEIVKKQTFLTRLKNKLFPTKNIVETSFAFQNSVLNQKGKIHLKGYWQNEKYFKEIDEVIKKDFAFKTPPNEINSKYLQEIKSHNSISIHFRRGDYLTNKSASDFHGVCPVSYYQKAITYIKSKIADPHFYIFSDDIKWVKDNYHFDDTHFFIDINKGKSSFEDLRLMSGCSHNIIANSSFSWWGAWLNNNPNKIVVAPLKWFNDTHTEIIPDSWNKI